VRQPAVNQHIDEPAQRRYPVTGTRQQVGARALWPRQRSGLQAGL
jgi:hypothetical protein